MPGDDVRVLSTVNDIAAGDWMLARGTVGRIAPSLDPQSRVALIELLRNAGYELRV